MTRLDRYILRQLVAALGFFLLVFTGVIWLTQAVRLIDTVVASGQSARVFLEFSGLVLPQVLVIVLPLAGIGAALARAQQALHRQRARGDDGRRLRARRACCGRSRSSAALLALGDARGADGAGAAHRRDPRRAHPRDPLRPRQRADRRAAVPAPGRRADAVHRRGRAAAARWRGIFLNDQRDPARAGDLLGRARAPAARGDGGAAGHARGRGARQRHGGRADRGALRRVRLRPQRPDCARTATGCRARRNIRCRRCCARRRRCSAAGATASATSSPRATTS